jgi:F-type H+-transporting ATPase subunit gamma
MAKARKILKRVKAVKSIRTVTKTMEMVSTARFKKVHDQVVGAKPYAQRLSDIVADVIKRTRHEDFRHPLLEPKGSNRHVLMVLTSNRGLAGAYNGNVIRLGAGWLERQEKDGNEVALRVAGKRGIQYFRFRGRAMEKTYTQFDQMPSFDQVKAIADEMMAAFLTGKIAGFDVAYMQFVRTGVQQPTIAQMLPLSGLEPAKPQAATTSAAYEFIPSGKAILEQLLPATVRVRLFQCFLDAAVAEQVARMAAMKAATENADEMTHTLTVRYNRTRQSQITTELAEIMGGQLGMK